MGIRKIGDKMRSSFKNGILGDATFKMIANVIATIIRNVVVLPFLAKIFISSEYGEIVTVIGIVTTISAGFGNALLSTRLVTEETYKNKSLEGDFNLICLIVSGFTMFASIPICIIFSNTCGSQYILVSLLLGVETFVGYHSGWFILRQEYKRLLYYTIFTSLGFGIGLILSRITSIWITTYLASDICSLLFLLRYSPLVREKIRFTPYIRTMLIKYSALIISTILSNAIAYMDRLFLHPMIGSEAVAVYTTASVFGKAFNLIALPISSILLGYYAVGKIQLNLRRYWIINAGTIVALVVFMLSTIFIGRWFTGVLYPELIDEAAPYIFVANLSSALAASAQITKAAALKYAKLYWSLAIQGVYSALYIILGYRFILIDGLRGFSYAVLIVNIIQLLLLYIICSITMKRRTEQENHYA